MQVDADCSLGLGKFFIPGFRFHPTDEELVLFYLKGKICKKKHSDEVIGETDVYKWDPEELPGLSKLKTGDRQWFFFSPRDRKYPNAARSSRATSNGYWKATGKDRVISYGSRAVGVKKTLIFYEGRAPGSRTDWVMHEYTLDEEELKRCRTAKDYFALYKVFKKSGLGPKNGEQYGAPFREEDWADDDKVDVQFLADNNVNPRKKSDENKPCNNDESIICGTSCLPVDLEDFISQIADDLIPVPPFEVDNGLSLDEFLSEIENQSSIVSHPSFDKPFSGLESEAPDVLHLNVSAPEPYIFEESFFSEDFLEMNDLIDPEPTVQNLDLPKDNLTFNEFDSLDELDFYQNPASFLHEIGASEPSCSFFSNNENRTARLNPDTQVLYADETRHVSNLSTNESNEGLVPSIAGVTHHQFQLQYGTESGLSSALWNFVESIPSSPAMASENGLVNRTLGRMSSFRRIQINARNTNITTSTSTTTGKTLSGFLVVSLLGMLCAILWIVIGSSIRVLYT